MRFKNFTELNEEIDKLIEQNKYTEALDLLNEGINYFHQLKKKKINFGYHGSWQSFMA